MSTDDKSILLRQQEDGTWEEKPEPYVTIECETEEDFNHIKRCLEATRWIPVEERLPEKDGFYLVTMDGEIAGEDKPFTGLTEFENGKWLDDEDDYQCVLAWQPLPEPYRPSDEQPEDSQGI